MCIFKNKKESLLFISVIKNSYTHINGVRASITLFNFTLTYFIQSEIIHQFCSVHHLLIEYLPLQYFAQLVQHVSHQESPHLTLDALSRMPLAIDVL